MASKPNATASSNYQTLRFEDFGASMRPVAARASQVIPPLMLLGMFAVTPMALEAESKEYTATMR